ncbi:MAG: hypothetical protein H6728_08715 [Myxococcales bacterium]|nr:hypothetical protein [Myxococcales bacterium]
MKKSTPPFPEDESAWVEFSSTSTYDFVPKISRSDLIRALLPDEVAEEILSSSEHLAPFSLERVPEYESEGSSSSWEGVRSDFADIDGGLFGSQRIPAEKIQEASALFVQGFVSEKDHGVMYVALVDGNSRRCLIELKLDESSSFCEENVLEYAGVLARLSSVMRDAHAEATLKEVLISMEGQHHMLVPFFEDLSLFLYISFYKSWGTPSLMRLYFRRLFEEVKSVLS